MIWERRWHPLLEEWVTITSHRNTRPWDGASAVTAEVPLPAYVEECYLCPGNRRVSGAVNAAYRDIHVFDNDHPSFSRAAPMALPAAPGIYRNAPARGVCRVVCYSPRHDMTLAELDADRIAAVLECWGHETQMLAEDDAVRHVLVFENKGAIVGVSNPHPHCQIYGADFVFKTVAQEMTAMQRHLAETGRALFRDIIDTERLDGRRVVAENDRAIAFVPYFARFPYELCVAPKTAHNFLFELNDTERADLAAALQVSLVRLDNLWRLSHPYMLVVHQAPFDARPGYHCHIQIHPPLRQPGLQKFLAGVETGGGHFLNDKSPEEAAAELRAVPETHYKRA